MYREEEYLALSGVQHFAFCRRQWALIHIEREWEENLLTAEGELMHERAHNEAIRERRGDTLTVRGLTVRSSELGIWGKCDVVEFTQDPAGHPLDGVDGLWRPVPVEYKRGRSKSGDEDRMQLCAQAMCLEDMFACDLPAGFLYYGSTHSRERVELTPELRSKVRDAIEEMHHLYERRRIPKVKRRSRCRSCSLVDVCMPRATSRSAAAYVDQMLGGEK